MNHINLLEGIEPGDKVVVIEYCEQPVLYTVESVHPGGIRVLYQPEPFDRELIDFMARSLGFLEDGTEVFGISGMQKVPS
jgi:hypothetical protein